VNGQKEQSDAQPVQICRDVFSDSRKRHQILPPPLPELACVKSLKVLGVTISSRLSLSEHFNNVISSCARSLYAIEVLRAHGLSQVSRRYRKSTGQSWSRNYCTHPLLVGVCLSSRPTTSGRTSTPRCTIRIVPVTADCRRIDRQCRRQTV